MADDEKLRQWMTDIRESRRTCRNLVNKGIMAVLRDFEKRLDSGEFEGNAVGGILG